MTADFTPDRIDRALAVIAACGADPARWPDEERAAVLALATLPAVAEALAAARGLDALLGDWATLPVPARIDAAAISALPQAPAKVASAPLARRWFAGGAVAAAAAVVLVMAGPARLGSLAGPEIATQPTEIAGASAGSAVAAAPGEAGDAAFAAVFTPTADEEDLI